MFKPGDFLSTKKKHTAPRGKLTSRKHRFIVLEDSVIGHHKTYVVWSLERNMRQQISAHWVESECKKIGERPYKMYNVLYAGSKLKEKQLRYQGTVTGRFHANLEDYNLTDTKMAIDLLNQYLKAFPNFMRKV